jgi:hypothetical protein
MPEETPPDVANLQNEDSVDWLVARRKKLEIKKDDDVDKFEFENAQLDLHEDDGGDDIESDSSDSSDDDE